MFPRLSILSRVMTQYKNKVVKMKQEMGVHSEKDALGELWNIYYNNKDLMLLLDLLAESNGVAPSIRIMALFDKEFRVQCEPVAFK